MKKNVIVKEIKIDGESWKKYLDDAFKKKNKEVKIDGFRKGNAPKDMFIKKFGIETLYMDAVDASVDEAYQKVLKETKAIPVCEPKLDVKSINENEVVFEFTIITAPEVTLGEYKNLKIKKDAVKVTKEEIDSNIKALQTKYAEIKVKEDGAKVEVGDTAVIDFKGIVDGVELEGGSGENYPLEIGSNTFILGFEDGLVGLAVGDEKELNLKFPENYTKELKNKDVTFKVKVNEIKTRVLPELNEDFYADLGYDDVKTKEELEVKVKESIKEKKTAEAEDKYAEECLEKAASNMKVDINDEIIDDEIHHMIHQFEDQLKMQGLNIEQYYEYTGMTHEKLHEKMEPEATKRIKYRYLLEKVAEVEKIEVTDEEAEKSAEEMANNYGISKEEFIKAYGSLDVIKYDKKMRNAIEIIKGA
jgi:trigger factor